MLKHFPSLTASWRGASSPFSLFLVGIVVGCGSSPPAGSSSTPQVIVTETSSNLFATAPAQGSAGPAKSDKAPAESNPAALADPVAKPDPPEALTPPPAMPEPFTKEELPVELSWNFLGAWPDFLIPWGSQDPDATKPVDDGLWVYRRPMAADASEFAVGFEVLPNLVGDFEITLDYRDFKSKAVATDWKIPRIDFSGVVFAADDDFSPMHVLGIAHRRQVDDSLKATATQGKKGPDGNQRWAFKQVVVSRDSGRLRLVRQKTWMFYQTAPPASEDWITIGTWQIDPGVFRSVGFGLRSEDLQGNGEAVLMKLNIRANATKSR